ncbi:MAG: RagB/SusD family nutrient uptake outer membrane protein [Bacteroidota bacterium]
MKKLFFFGWVSLALLCTSCEDLLVEEPLAQLDTESYLSTQSGLLSVLNQAYGLMHRNGNGFTAHMHYDLIISGQGDGRAGAWEGSLVAPFRLWTWTPTQFHIVAEWNINYDVIYYTNIILDNLDNENFSEEFQNELRGQALALRAHAYYRIYDFFGPAVINTTTIDQELTKARASEEEFRTLIENDFRAAASLLPIEQAEYGRITQGAALGMLTKFLLNTKQWDKAASTAQEVIGLNQYALFPDYVGLFRIPNEGNEEVMWVHPQNNQPGLGNTLAALTYPGNFAYEGTQGGFPARITIPDAVVDAYGADDVRGDSTVFLRTYTARNGNTIQAYGAQGSVAFKYGLDSEALGANAGYDFIELRYADILLSRAEALNELNGPNEESITLLNQIRERAGISPVALADFADQGALRTAIFEERNLEFHFEVKARQDQIREGTFVSRANDRGLNNAADFQVLFPIPQRELDTNPKMTQNPGY